MASIAELSDKPRYTIKDVCTRTGIQAVTLRAWERRYRLLTPQRSDNRYRLYSERDIAVLRWVKNQVDCGSAISKISHELHSLMEQGQWPEVLPAAPAARTRQLTNPEVYSKQLYRAFIAHDEGQAIKLMHEIEGGFDLNTLCLNILAPCLVQIGEAWYHGEIHIATEHFASSFICGRLLNLLQAYPTRRGTASILIGCAPNENHEIGSLMLALLLRSKGLRVEYLGPDLPIADLVDYASEQRPDMIILNASMAYAASELTEVQQKLNKLSSPPIFGYGGQAFVLNRELHKRIAGIYLGDSLEEAAVFTRSLLNRPKESKRSPGKTLVNPV